MNPDGVEGTAGPGLHAVLDSFCRVMERCRHCGREGTVECKGHVVLSAATQTIRVGDSWDEITVQHIAQVDRCTGCKGLTLSEYQWIDGYMESDEVESEIIFPLDKPLDGLPSPIAERYLAMLELQHAPDVFAVRAGRLLEAICADKGISQDLSQRDQLNALIQEAGVPEGLVKQAHLVYTYRNYGGHLKELEVEDADVPLIRGFIDALLDFLYRGPANLIRVSAAFEKRKEEALNRSIDP